MKLVLGANPLSDSLSYASWGRSLAWIRRQPPELVFPGSNPGGPATHYYDYYILSDFICLILILYCDERSETCQQLTTMLQLKRK
jgi:hypothetical protein